jgi:hypothetical protein
MAYSQDLYTKVLSSTYPTYFVCSVDLFLIICHIQNSQLRYVKKVTVIITMTTNARNIINNRDVTAKASPTWAFPLVMEQSVRDYAQLVVSLFQLHLK